MAKNVNVWEELRELLDARDGRTVAEIKADSPWQEGVVAEATKHEDGGYTLSWDERRERVVRPDGTETLIVAGGAYGCGLSAERVGEREIKAGDTVRFYGRGFGSEFVGVDLNGEELFFRTPFEMVARRVTRLAESDREKRETLAAKREAWAADVAALPEPLRKRIERFEANDPGFWTGFPDYELFCCKEAAKFANVARHAVKTGACADVAAFWRMPLGDGEGKREPGTVFERVPGRESVEDATPEERWLVWAWALNSKTFGYDYNRQKEVLGCDDGHSGNTFGGSMALACALLRGEEV